MSFLRCPSLIPELDSVNHWATVPVKISRLLSNGYSSIRNSSFGYFSQ